MIINVVRSCHINIGRNGELDTIYKYIYMAYFNYYKTRNTTPPRLHELLWKSYGILYSSKIDMYKREGWEACMIFSTSTVQIFWPHYL